MQREEETVEEAVFRYVRGLDEPDVGDDLWSGRPAKRPRPDDDEQEGQEDDDDDDELLSRETSVQAQLPTSKRVQQYLEVLPKFGPAKGSSRPVSSQRLNGTYSDTVIRLARQAQDVVNHRGAAMYSADEDRIIDQLVDAYKSYEDMTDAQFRDTLWNNRRKAADGPASHALTEFWKSLYTVMAHRTEQSLYQHVRRRFHAFDKRGTWSAADDNTLWELCHTRKLEGSWTQVGAALGRRPDDCRDRWRNYVKLRDTQKKNKWTAEEVARLREIVAQVPGGAAVNWDAVSEQMGGTRSRLQCRSKWKYLEKRAKPSPPPSQPSQPDC
ncbi:hypothetical protein DAKH74_046680 [Maudiozyma humilis]|uniref:Uncharacterized protein n=1 Tax=Maudiozyma humilis TaxID=51915 RepID=A0AAV5S370_MAUHU|nr:hypothetical protein DAKH74_046680 [Kazachstania humilis]